MPRFLIPANDFTKMTCFFLECIKNGNLEDVPDLLVTIRPEIQWALNALKELNRFDTQFRYSRA